MAWLRSDSTHHSNRIIFILALVASVVGILARVIGFDVAPPGLNQDEASIGYEAWSLLHYGIDRNGVSWPVHLISWGSGQNALYAWLAMPFIGAFGLSPVTTRLPMLISGLLSLPLVWWIGRKLFGEMAGLGAVVLVALNPWHIMLSRWGLESNVLPFMFLCGLFLISFPLRGEVESGGSSLKSWRWLAACALFALCLYAYGPAYLAIPLFVLGAVAIGWVSRAMSWKAATVGLVVFTLVALPIGLFIAVNTFKWDTLVIAGISMPRMPATPRFASQLAEGGGPFAHAGALWQLLVTQRDGTLYNITDPYGVMYSVAFFALGLALAVATIVFAFAKRWPPQRALIALWIVACLPTGIVQEPNINRINLLLMGLVVAAGIGLGMLDAKVKGAFIAGTVALLAMFGFFTRDYFTTQRDKLAPEFLDGLLPALQHAQSASATDGLICVSGKVNMPYIYALFTEETDPREFNRTVKYVDATAPFREVTSFGQYTFGLERCNFASAQTVVARNDEGLPEGIRAEKTSFSGFDVYILK